LTGYWVQLDAIIRTDVTCRCCPLDDDAEADGDPPLAAVVPLAVVPELVAPGADDPVAPPVALAPADGASVPVTST
jgi:hypothetical protein